MEHQNLVRGTKPYSLWWSGPFKWSSTRLLPMVIIQTVKKGGKEHSLFILNGMQTNTTQHFTVWIIGTMLP